MKTCKNCGVDKNPDEFYSNGWQKTGKRKYKQNCKACEQELRHRRRWIKIQSILGSIKCEICGYDYNLAAIEFHHKDPNKKDFKLSDIRDASVEVLKKELRKCMTLCANCHREEHNKHMEKSRILS